MIKYIFNLEEIKCMLFTCGGVGYKCEFFDMQEFTQEEYDRGLASLLGKGIISKVDTETIAPDRMFEELFRVIITADYTVMQNGYLAAISDIVILIEKDRRSDGLYKLVPLPNMDEFKEYCEIGDEDVLKVYAGAGMRDSHNTENMCIQENYSYIKELVS